MNECVVHRYVLIPAKRINHNLRPKSEQKLLPGLSLSQPAATPNPGTQPTSAKHNAKSVAKPTEKTINFRRVCMNLLNSLSLF